MKYYRSVFGVAVGILSVVAYSVLISFLVDGLAIKKNDWKERQPSKPGFIHRERDNLPIIVLSTLLVFSIIMIILSGLFIMGIIKKLHKLMLPWLTFSIIGFNVNGIGYLVSLIVMIVNEEPFDSFVDSFFTTVLTIVTEGLVLWETYKLYKDIQEKNNNDANGRVVRGPEASYVADSKSHLPQTNYYSQFPAKN